MIGKSIEMENGGCYPVVNGVSEQDLCEFKLMFQALDRNKDGLVTTNEFQNLMKRLGYTVSDEKALQCVKTLHKTGQGQGVTEREFIAWISKYREQNPEAVLRDAFQALDKDQNGFISRDELKQGLELMGQKVSDGAVNTMMRVADRDKDGRLSFKEFVRIMRGCSSSPRK